MRAKEFTFEEKQKGVDGKVCWKGYKRMGTKQKGGKTVDNCVKMEGMDTKCPPATQDITLNLENRQKAIDEYGYGPMNPAMPNNKFWMKKVDEWNLDSAEEAKQSLCGNCAAFDVRQDTLDCIATGIDADNPEDAEGVIEAGDLGYCKFLKFKCASKRTCDAWVGGGPLTDDKQDVEEEWSKKYKDSINCSDPKGFSQKAHCAGKKNNESLEETYEGDEFHEAYGEMYYNEDEQLDEAEYQGRKVSLGKPMQGDVKKFKVYVKNPKGNVVKVNFGDPDMRIRKSNPARRKSFRARHNCANPGPRHKARYWSCRKW